MAFPVPRRRAAGAVFTLLALSASFPLLAESRLGLVTDLTTANFDSFISGNDRVLVDFYQPNDASWAEDSKQLQDAVRDARNMGSTVPIAKVDIVRQGELTQKYVPNGPFPQLLWFQHGQVSRYHRSLRKSKNVLDFVLALDRDPITAFSSEEDVRTSVNRAVWAEVPKSSAIYKALEVVASKHMDVLQVAWSESSKMEVKWIEESKDDKEDTEAVPHKEMIYSGKAEPEALDKWVRAHLTRSEPLPPPQHGDSVIVVGQTFEEIVLQPEKDVFLLIYAPWCGFSRKFIPTWETFARHVGHVQHLVVAKMDGDLNSSPYPEEFSWRAYPTVFFVRAGEKQPVVFHGNRTIARLLAFAREHGSKELPAELDAAVSGTGGSDLAEWEL
jgi:thioredoxin-like negative regulator of GroEL